MNAERAGVKADRRSAWSPGGMAATPRVSLWAFGLLLAGATAGVFLAGGLPQGSLGIFLLCAGAALTFCPPQAKVEWRLWIAAAALVGCGALAFLPENWFGVPAWRRTLEAAPAIHLPATITAVPWETGFWLAMLALSLLVGLFLLAHPLRSRWMFAFALLAAAAAGGYAALAIYAKGTGWRYPFASEATFGFFPNRNHTATLLVAGSLLALGVLSVALREGRWIAGLLAAGTVAVCVAALVFFSASRGGIVFLLVGIVLWFSGLGRRHRDRRMAVSFTCVLLAAGVLFLVSGSEVRERLLAKTKPDSVMMAPPVPWPVATASGTDHDDTMHNLSAEFRLKIYHDAFDAIRDFPLTGTGLGTFASVFPQYRHASLTEALAIHPESDWLMLAAESGIPAMLCALALVVLAARRLPFEREHPYWPLRWGCAVAAGTAVLHGIVDVPIHRVPLGWWVLVVAGLALQSVRLGVAGRSPVQRALFVAGGLVALVFGGKLVQAQWFGGTPLPPFAYAAAHTRFYRTVQHDRDGALLLAGAMIRKHPMENEAYLCLGQTYLLYYESDAFVDNAFAAQRLLDPNRVVTALAQGSSWLHDDPARAATLWLDALARRVRLSRAAGERDHGQFAEFFGELVQEAAAYPEVQKQLWSTVRQGPGFAFAWIENATPPLASDGVGHLSTDEDFLGRLDAAGQRRFLRDWYTRGDRAGLVAFLDARPEWQLVGWPARLRQLADAQQYERAVREAASHYGFSLVLPEPGSALASVPPIGEQESNDPVAAFTAYWKIGNTRSARRVVDEAVNRATAPQAAALWQLKTVLAVHDADWPLAWSSLQRRISLEHPDDAW